LPRCTDERGIEDDDPRTGTDTRIGSSRPIESGPESRGSGGAVSCRFPSLSARWSIETSLLFADSALSEIDGSKLRGYGSLADGLAEEIEAVFADLRDAVVRGRALLREADAAAIRDKVNAVEGAAGEVLRVLDEITIERGLADVRPYLAALAERWVSEHLDVGVFGRVSAGKSSLINACVGHAVLPVGATPVTMVPARITRGAPRVLAYQADGRAVEADLAAIEPLVSRESNPGNRLAIASLDIRVPTAPEGIRLLDTPGVGSFATSVAAQAFAWLPRCDLGLVLVTASGAIEADDVALVSGLRAAGVEVRILISKVDLLDAAQLDRAFEYVVKTFGSVFGGEAVSILAVSTLSADGRGLEALQRLLAQRAAEHRAGSRSRLRERLRGLVTMTEAALSGPDQRSFEEAVELRKVVQAAERQVEDLAGRMAASVEPLREAVARDVAAAWQGGRDGGTAFRARILEHVAGAVSDARSVLDNMVAAMGHGDEDAVRMPPAFEIAGIENGLDFGKPHAPGLTLHALASRRLRNARAPMAEALERYAEQLRRWATVSLAGLMASGAVSAVTGVESPPELHRLHQLLDDDGNWT